MTSLLIAGFSVHFAIFRPRIEDRIYRIGLQELPPFQQIADDGSPTGLAVDLVREAARRRGIRLQWIPHGGPSEAALRERSLDLWPLMTVTPEREKEGAIHISKPYLQHDHSLVVLASSGYVRPGNLTGRTISYRDQPINLYWLRKAVPNARHVPAETHRTALERLCEGSTDAVFIDEFSAGTIMLSGAVCQSRRLQVIPLPTIRSQLGIGSTPEAALVADEIRRGIDTTTLEGDLARSLTHVGYYSRRNLEYFTRLVNSQKRERGLMLLACTFAGLFVLVVLAAGRILLQRNRIRLTGQALTSSEQKLSLLANNLSEIVLAYDMDQRLAFASPSIERLTGYSASDLENDTSFSWVHPDDRLRMTEYRNKVFAGGVILDEEYRLITKDERTRWVIATWGPVYDSIGKQVGVQRSERDITERKLAEHALHESDRRFRELLESVQLVAIISDANGTTTFCNDYALDLTGWSKDEIIGQPSERVIDAGQCPVAPGGVCYCEGSILRKNGARRDIQWNCTPLRDSDGQPAGCALLGEDVTELRNLRARAAQMESEDRFRNIADTAPLMLWVAEPDKGCTFVNKGWLAFTGRTLEEELGSGWTGNVHAEDLERCLAAYTKAFDDRKDFQIEYRKQRSDGEYRWVLGCGVPRYDVEGKFTGYAGSCTDITDMKRSRDEDLARQKLENVGRLASGIAHDFNNLLGGVLAQADLALSEVDDGVTPREQLETIRNVAMRGAGIVRQLMIYAGQESGASEPVDLSLVIADMLELLKVLVSRHTVLDTKLAHDLPLVHANPAQLQQLVMNLVTNASEALGKKDGRVTIRTSRTGEDGFGARERVKLEVSDSGSGIPPAVQQRMFDPFFTTKTTGKGLGLSVVHGIVQGLGGQIRVSSQPGCGSTFEIVLPSADSGTKKNPVHGSRDGADAHLTDIVMVVEDEEPLRNPTVKALRREGLTVMEAADGTTALSLLREHHAAIRVILLDITLPGTPSSQVFAEARRLRPDVTVIVMSAYGPKKALDSFPNLELSAFIRKPFRLAELVSLVRSFPDIPSGHSRYTVSGVG